MIRLNGIEYEHRPGLTLCELADRYSAEYRKLCFDGFVVIVDGQALTTDQAQAKILEGNEDIFIVPVLDGG